MIFKTKRPSTTQLRDFRCPWGNSLWWRYFMPYLMGNRNHQIIMPTKTDIILIVQNGFENDLKVIRSSHFRNIITVKSTLMRSSNKEDLNIQSSLTSSFRRRSCRLPREQCSVTMANISQSVKNPKNGLTFSFRRSFIWEL